MAWAVQGWSRNVVGSTRDQAGEYTTSQPCRALVTPYILKVLIQLCRYSPKCCITVLHAKHLPINSRNENGLVRLQAGLRIVPV